LGVFTVKKIISEKKEPKLRQKVQLALLCPLTGEDAFFGEGAKVSVETALSHLSKGGAFKKFSIELLEPIDDQNLTSEATVSASMAVRLNPHVCIGHQKTEMTLVSAPLFEENKIPFISMSKGTAPVSNGWEYLHMGVPIYRDIEKTMADYLILERKIESFAVVVADEYEFRDASRNFISSIDKGKISVKQFKLFANDEKFELKAADEGEVEKQIEAIVFFGVGPENATKIMELFRSFGGVFSKSPIVAFGIPADIDKDYDLIEQGYTKELVFVDTWNPDSDRPVVKNFVKDFMKAHPGEQKPNRYDAGIYDAVMNISEAVMKLFDSGEDVDVFSDNFNVQLNLKISEVFREGVQGMNRYASFDDGSLLGGGYVFLLDKSGETKMVFSSEEDIEN